MQNEIINGINIFRPADMHYNHSVSTSDTDKSTFTMGRAHYSQLISIHFPLYIFIVDNFNEYVHFICDWSAMI